MNNNNRNYPRQPPYGPPPYGPPPGPPYRQPRQQRQQQGQGFSDYAPREAVGHLAQSQHRLDFYREMLRKVSEGQGALAMGRQNLEIALERRGDPDGLNILLPNHESMDDKLTEIQQYLQYGIRFEMDVQAGLKRWLMGLPPIPSPPRGGQARVHQGPPPQLPQGQGQGQGQGQQQKLPSQSRLPPGDLRDPEQAQAFLERAEPMPLGPQPIPMMTSPMPQPMQQPMPQYMQPQPQAQPVMQQQAQPLPVPTALQYEQAAAQQPQQQQTNGAAKS